VFIDLRFIFSCSLVEEKHSYFRSNTGTSDSEWQARLSARDVAEGSSVVGLGLVWFENNCDFARGVWPNVSFRWVYLHDIIRK